MLSRVASDAYFPRLAALGYLRELHDILRLLNQRQARAHVFFRQCTLPTPHTLELIRSGAHQIGLHLENSVSYEAFLDERARLERHIHGAVTSFSKHGSGGAKYGRRHHAPYEPEKYADWGRRANMTLFLGNLEDPTLPPRNEGSLLVYPSAFWLEPPWRDTQRFPVDWLARESLERDIVLLIHPENVLAEPELTRQLSELLAQVPTTTLDAIDACN